VTPPRSLVLAVVVAAGTFALAGCGASHATSHASSSTGIRSGTVDVAIKNFAFSPANLTVTVGTKVVWTQDDSTVHTVTDAGQFDSGTLAQGATYSRTFTTPGTYPYICSIHTYMKATITVVP
jgi:plastocyanin